MALNAQETEWLRTAAENTVANRQLLETHTQQIGDLLAVQQSQSKDITRVDTIQAACQKRNAPGNKAERVGVVAAIFFGLAALFWQVVTYLSAIK